MKLKTRLIIAFLIIILVPAVLCSISFFGFTRYQMNAIEESYGVPISYDNISDSMQVIGLSTQEIFEELNTQATTDPEKLLDETYLDQINESLEEKHSFLLVRRDGKVYYNGSGSSVEELMKSLPAYSDFTSAADGGFYVGKKVHAFVKQLDIQLKDGSDTSVFVVSSAKKIISQTKKLLRDLILSIMIILIFTAFLMIVWIYTGIHTPLQKLSEATHRIKEEDFDFEIEVRGNDEISELCRDFDEMRQRLKDVDEQKKTFDRQSKELISNISHDLKTPITAVKGYVEGIMDGVADTPEKMDRYIRTIYIKANDMDRLINELTFYSKIDTNRIPYNFNKIDVAEYFDDCAEDVGLEMRERNITFSYINTVEPGVQVIADAEQMKRVINNIIGNSVKYMDKEKQFVQLRVMDVGDFIQVEIEDNGKGIPNKELAVIFDRFYRTDLSRNSAQGGSGIGLSIVKKIIDDHGGRIWATSRLGEGTIMHFEIRKYQEGPVHE
jgi:signal transduction histidine kinase